MVNKILILMAFLCLFNLTIVSAEKIVIFAMDDFQVWWLEDIQEYIVQTHIDNNIPVTLGVIPSGIEDPWGAGERITERIQRWDANPIIEVAQHGYDHEDYFEGMSYSSQYALIKEGNDLMKGIGLLPNSFIPPFGSADLNTINVLIALGFHTLYNPVEMNPASSGNLLIIQNQLVLCRDGDEGPDCVYKDYSTIKSEIDQKIQADGVALVLYHMQDFDDGNENIDTYKASQIVDYANQLKNDGYTLMTVEQYYQHLNNFSTGLIDNDKDGYDETKDCNDNDAAIHPGAAENICNGIDNDCDLSIDENYLSASTGCGIGQCASSGLLQCISGKETNSCVPNLPTAEICNGLDDDCDGLTDENLTTAYYKDADADGYGNPSLTVQACSVPLGHVSNSLDCNDNNLAIHPNAIETCDSIDNNCNNQIDEGNFCGVCGNAVCEPANQETCSSCQSDCGICSVKTITIRPNGYGYRTGWTNVNCASGFSEWQCVSETTYNTTDFLKNTGTAKETFAFSNTGLTTEKINSITLYYYASRNLYLYNSCFEAMIRYNERDYLSGTQMCVGTFWQYVSQKYEKNPATNLPWTVAEVEALEAGMHALDPNGGGRISQVYAVVEYQ
jgi:peptidoglycan/xylan/chitin deacetylase (PgdA/CDA1 family)